MARKKRKNTKRQFRLSIGLLLAIGLYVALCLLLPLRAIAVASNQSELKITTAASNLPWPNYGEAAFGFNGSVIRNYGAQTPRPTASVAKLITALTVLNKYPLSLGQNGPNITITAADYADYGQYIAEQGSIVPVSIGEQLSERKMLEAMLIPSGNNIADALAVWAYGSMPAYISSANLYMKHLGIDQTTIATDASGYSPATTSTANDLVKLGSLVMANPVLAQINAMKSVMVPNVGVMTNYDSLLGSDGIVGIKTGNSNQAGGVFVGAAQTTINNKVVTILTAIMGAPTLNQALADTRPLVISLEHDFAQTIIINQGEVLGEYKQPWGGFVQVTAKSNLLVDVLQGQTARAYLSLKPLNIPSQAGQTVGGLITKADAFNSSQKIAVVLVQSTSRPSWQWRLTHPEYIF